MKDDNSEQLSGQAEDVDDIESQVRSFVTRATAALQPELDSVLGDRTRSTQSLLLASAMVVLLVSLGLLHVNADKLDAGPVVLSIVTQKAVLSVGAFVVLYFEILFAIQSATDWNAYELKSAVASLDKDRLMAEVARSEPRLSDFLRARAELYDAGDLEDPEILRQRRAEAQRKLAKLRRDLILYDKKIVWTAPRIARLRVLKTVRLLWEVAFPLCLGGAALWNSFGEIGQLLR